MYILPQMLPGSGNVRHVFIQDVFLGANAVVLNVLGPVQLAHVKVKCLTERKPKRTYLFFHLTHLFYQWP